MLVLHLWSIFITFMVGIIFMVFLTFMVDRAVVLKLTLTLSLRMKDKVFTTSF